MNERKAPRVVINREAVSAGFRISIRVPKSPERGENVENGKPYFVKKLYVSGGRFCVHIYGDDLNSYRGRTIRASVVIEKKTFQDGSVEYYANVFETDDPSTHTLRAYERKNDYEPKDGDETYPCADGIIVVALKPPETDERDAA